MMQYKGYLGRVEFDAQAGILHGEVLGIRDVVTFQGKSVAEVQQAFHDSVDDYLTWCEQLGEEPDKPCSGRFVVRLDSELHRKLNLLATAEGTSLNTWVSKRLQEAADQQVVSRVAHRRAGRKIAPASSKRKRPARPATPK